jgi:DnaJ-class molecular chaperone
MRECPVCSGVWVHKWNCTLNLKGNCPECGGEGYAEIPHPLPDDPYFCKTIQCEACSGTGTTSTPTAASQDDQRRSEA